MKINREELLKILTVAAVGLTPREVFEQSHSFVFTKKRLVTFNGEVFTSIETPLPEIRGAVPAEDLLKLLGKFPDEEVEVVVEDSELRVKGGKRRAFGVTMGAEVHLPYKDVPEPGEWLEIPAELPGTLLQAARVCGRDEAQPRTTEVHVTSSVVEACDNFRLFRYKMETGVEGELLLPASSIEAIGDIPPKKMSIASGWLHLKTKKGHQISLRCSTGKYPDLTTVLQLKSPKKIQLPPNLGDILARAEIMQDYNSMVGVEISEGSLTLNARKETGWYREQKQVEYSDDPLKFEVNLRFLQEILAKTRKVSIGENKMQIKSGEAVFVVCLEVPEEKKEKPKIKKKAKAQKRGSDEEE